MSVVRFQPRVFARQREDFRRGLRVGAQWALLMAHPAAWWGIGALLPPLPLIANFGDAYSRGVVLGAGLPRPLVSWQPRGRPWWRS
jgi:hypothetical protein